MRIKKEKFQEPRKYRIRIKGRLDAIWSDWFEGGQMSYEKGISVLEVEIKDQANLHGLLNRIRDLNMILISLEPVDQEVNQKEPSPEVNS